MASPPCRYFLMRCAEARLLDRAVHHGMWPVSLGAVEALNAAFATGEPPQCV